MIKNNVYMKRVLVLFLIVVMLFGTTTFLSGCSGAGSNSNGDGEKGDEIPSATTGHFASVHINTPQTRPEDFVIHRDDWYRNARMTVTGALEEHEFENVPMRIRGRGNSSWRIGTVHGKKPFRIRFEQARSMFGTTHVARDWSFIANHSDFSLIRNYTAYTIGHMLQDTIGFVTFHRFVHVYMNGEYKGVFLFVEQMEVLEGRVDTQFHPDPTISEHYIQKCARLRGVEWLEWFQVNGRRFELRTPREANVQPAMLSAHMAYIQTFLLNVEEAIRRRDWVQIQRWVDIPSFVDFYLVQELFKDPDAGWSSLFMTIRGQGENRRLHMGHLWDFDVAAGNWAQMRSSTPVYGNSIHGIRAAQSERWANMMLAVPQFRSILHARLEELVPVFEKAFKQVRQTTETYAEHFNRNFYEAWDVIGTQMRSGPNGMTFVPLRFIRTSPSFNGLVTWQGHVDYLLDFWLPTRLEWMLSPAFGALIDAWGVQ